MTDAGDDIRRDDDTFLDELVHNLALELGRADAASKAISVPLSLSVVASPTPTRVSLAVLS